MLNKMCVLGILYECTVHCVTHYFCLQTEKEKRLQTEKIRIAMNKLKEARVKKASIVSCSQGFLSVVIRNADVM